MLIDSDEAIKRMQNVIEYYKKYGYMEEVMYRMAVALRDRECGKKWQRMS